MQKKVAKCVVFELLFIGMNAKEFKRKRMSLGLTQSDLAGMLDVSSNTVSRYETGLIDIPKVVELAMTTIAAQVEEKDALEAEQGDIGDIAD